MKLSKIFLAAALLALCACQPAQKDDNQGGMRDVTDTTSCVGPASQFASIYNTWHMKMTNDQIALVATYKIDKFQTTVTNTCIFHDGESVDVSVVVPSRVEGNQLVLTQSQANKTHKEFGANSYDCSVASEASSIAFSYVGNCLLVNRGDGHLSYMVP